METEAAIHCPWCDQLQVILVDTTIPDQRLTYDCENCCRPFEVRVTARPGEILGLDAAAD